MRVRASPAWRSEWFHERTGYHLPSDFTAIEAVDGGGLVQGVVAYDHWTPNSAQIHVVLESASAAIPLLRKAFEHPFLRAKVGVLVGVVPAHNESCLKLAKRLGFVQMCRIRDGWRSGVDTVILELRKENCRWIPKEATT